MEIYQTEEQQVEAIKGYWEENGNMIIAGIVLFSFGYIIWLRAKKFFKKKE